MNNSRRQSRIFSGLMLAVLVVSLFAPPAVVEAQGTDAAARAKRLLAELTPEERVGQLFLVTFPGTDVSPESKIYDLIANYNIGGVVLTAANDNFVSAPDTISSVNQTIISLQRIEWEAALRTGSPANTYIPLFIGLSQEGGGHPNDQVLNGLSPLPDQMALGATWNPELARQVGEVMGRELSSLGVNFYLGLSLDVLSNPSQAVSADLSTRVFGGDPYWVGEMGRAYLIGLHSGSQGRMAVIPKHFPGRGGTDRLPEQEVPTVRRSLEELKQVELAPFFAVTGDTQSAASADGFLVSHIRYQGFQGNIRATTRPVSFDQQALGQISNLPQIAAWRQNGGLFVSDDLGTAAVRRFYDPGQQGFFARLVARDAFLAGNDLLYMGNIISSDAEDNSASVLRALEFFAQKYREDPAFAQRVDESVLRILTLKYRLYPVFSFPIIEESARPADDLGQSRDVSFTVARQSATLLSPSLADYSTFIPDPPALRDYIIFFTDSRSTRQCSTCAEEITLPKDSLQGAVMRLYGPEAGGLVLSNRASSYSFDDLALYLDGKSPSLDLNNQLRRANWVVFSTQNLPEGKSQLETFRRFFAEKQSLLLNKRVILFSFNAPYYLDATDIANLSAYFALYSETDPFIDVAARLLFQEIPPGGSSPVSIAGLGYDLISVTAPNPGQVISLSLDLPPATPPPDGTSTPEPTPAPVYRVGDSLSLRTGVIYDHNGRPVPDGTVVRFSQEQGEGGLAQQVDATTTQGVARVSIRLEKPGLVKISAASEPALVSDVIEINVTDEGSTIIIITPTAVETPEPTPVVLATPEPTPPPSILVTDSLYPSFSGWLVLFVVLAAGAALTYWLVMQAIDPRWAARWALLVLAGGLVTYNYLVLDMPGAAAWLAGRGFPAFLQAIVFGQVLGFLAGWAWRASISQARD
jgi:beta-N-acetylhexosaminidase